MKKITIVGAGNLGTHLANVLFKNGYTIVEIISQSENSAKNLALSLNTKWKKNLNHLDDTDLIIVCVPDDKIYSVIEKIPNIPIVHTSGSTSIDIFKDNFSEYGVIYPIQTFNKNIQINFSEIPLCIEGNCKKFERKILKLSNDISESVQLLDSKSREYLHIAAIFACNFTNHLFSISEDILNKHNLSFDIIMPLIKKTIEKLETGNIKNLQTGPAKRKDIKVIKKHLMKIKNNDYKELYKIISNQIMKNE